METIILPREQFEELLNSMDEIKSMLSNKKEKPEDTFLNNRDFIKLMNISKRTAQTWRDEGKISFSQIGGKIYYRLSDVEKLLNNNRMESFKLPKVK